MTRTTGPGFGGLSASASGTGFNLNDNMMGTNLNVQNGNLDLNLSSSYGPGGFPGQNQINLPTTNNINNQSLNGGGLGLNTNFGNLSAGSGGSANGLNGNGNLNGSDRFRLNLRDLDPLELGVLSCRKLSPLQKQRLLMSLSLTGGQGRGGLLTGLGLNNGKNGSTNSNQIGSENSSGSDPLNAAFIEGSGNSVTGAA